MATWHTIETARAQWNDAAQMGDDVLSVLLDVAKEQVLAYAPAITDDEEPPTRYVFGQLRQAQNLWNAVNVQSGDPDDFQPITHPLDWHVKNILRPQGGVPRVG